MFYAINGNRSIAWGSCFVSVSSNGSWVSNNLFNAAESCYNFCGSISITCEVYNVNLGGYIVDQCISNRPEGVTKILIQRIVILCYTFYLTNSTYPDKQLRRHTASYTISE